MNDTTWTVRDDAMFLGWSNTMHMRLMAAKFRLKELFRTMQFDAQHITYGGVDEP